MTVIKKVFDDLKGVKLAYAQIFLVLVTFTATMFIFYSRGQNREHEFLLSSAEDKMIHAQSYIEAHLNEAKTALANISESVRIFIVNDEPVEIMHVYLNSISDYLIEGDDILESAIAVYGLFYCFDDEIIIGGGGTPSDDFILEQRPWYTAAIQSSNEIVMVGPYPDLLFGELVVTFVREIQDDHGEPLGIVGLDISFSHIADYAINTRITPDGYCLMTDHNLDVIAHPDPRYYGLNVLQLNDGEKIAVDMLSGERFGTYETTSYLDEPNTLFWYRFNNDWYLGVMTPTGSFNANMRNTVQYFILVGAIMTVLLSALLLRVTASKVKSDDENRQKSNFLAMISHEIRTPLNAIIGVAEIELADNQHPTALHESFSRIYNSGYALLSIINDLLDLSKIEAGKMEIIPSRYDVASLINDIVNYNIVRINTKTVQFELNVDAQMPSILIGDEIRIKQVLNNVLSNAFKYTDSGKITFNITCEASPNDGFCLLIAISDTGKGMSPEQVDKLFNEYTRFNSYNSRETVGTGLGMNITKRLMDLMEGTISIQSEPGVGSVFTLMIPQQDIAADEIGPVIAEQLKQFRVDSKKPFANENFAREYMPYGRVLIVDDMESNLYVAKGLLIPYGLAIDTAESGFEAIEIIKAGNRYDLILMDHMMPRMDGIEAVKAIRGLGYKQAIVALTANAMQGQSDVFLSNGFDGFISKPIDIRQLDLTLNAIIRDRHSAEEIEQARKQKQHINEYNAATYSEEVSKAFVKDAEKCAAALEGILKRWQDPNPDDMSLYAINAHAMKSALANVGEADLSDTAARLEKAAGQSDQGDSLPDKTAAFLLELRAVVEKLRPTESHAPTGDISPEDKVFLRDTWRLINTACLEYNENAVNQALAALNKKSLPGETRAAIDALSEHMLHSDFDEAAAIARQEADRWQI